MIKILFGCFFHVQAAPPKFERQLFGGPPSGAASRQMYQSRFALWRDDFDSMNQDGDSKYDWERSQQASCRACTSASNASKSASDPKIASISV